MPGDIQIPLAAVHSFVLVLFRIGGLFIFAPIPGVRNGPHVARVILAVSITLALYSKWPALGPTLPGLGEMLLWGLSELALGVTAGLLVSLSMELFAVGAQAISLPAGFTYASAVDPATQAESNVLVILAQLTAGLLFFAFGLHQQLIWILARSLEAYPPGSFVVTEAAAEQVLRVGSAVFQLGFGLVLPILALLAMIDIALALLGRLSSQLQVITLSFPVKLLATLAVMAAIGTVMPRLFARSVGSAISILKELLTV